MYSCVSVQYIIVGVVVRFSDALQMLLNASVTTLSASTLCQDETPTATVAPS